MAGFVKVVKNRSYFKRFQVKFRRRRNGVTDYYARRRLIAQDKNKYESHKHRLIVRITNKKIICQVAYATLTGDVVICAADSHELKHYGLQVGYTNYAAAYCTGLLIARKLLKKYKLDSRFVGNSDPEQVGEDRDNGNPESDGPRTFRVILDIGLARSTTGARVFGVMKGALDGGLNIPHGIERFPGYDSSSKEYSPEQHRSRIFGLHVSQYMKQLQEEDEDAYQRQFSQYIKSGITHDKLEDMYKEIHTKIRTAVIVKQSYKSEKKLKKATKTKMSKRQISKMQKIATFKNREALDKRKQEFVESLS